MLLFRKPAMLLGCVLTRGFRKFGVTQNTQRVASICVNKYSNNQTNTNHFGRGLHTSITPLNQTQETAEQVTENWHICHDTVADGVKKRLITLIDVRRPEEIDALGYIPTAHNIPVDEIETALQLSNEAFEKKYNFPKPSPAGPPIVLYCRSGVRAGRACTIFGHFNYYNVGNYRGSWNEWSEKHPEDVRVHPVTDRQG